MVREPDEIEVLELEFDDENLQHLADHGVEQADVLDVWLNAPRFFRNLEGRGGTHVMLGPDKSGRFFYIALVQTGVDGRWRPVTGYPYNRRRALRYYGGEGE
ncbi:MAG TPA: hypothetical protein VJB57_19870 [Dehalococcoidia bacterium]|nr:hypothetical protein [Dehalococcoidia bacterium]